MLLLLLLMGALGEDLGIVVELLQELLVLEEVGLLLLGVHVHAHRRSRCRGERATWMVRTTHAASWRSCGPLHRGREHHVLRRSEGGSGRDWGISRRLRHWH